MCTFGTSKERINVFIKIIECVIQDVYFTDVHVHVFKHFMVYISSRVYNNKKRVSNSRLAHVLSLRKVT